MSTCLVSDTLLKTYQILHYRLSNLIFMTNLRGDIIPIVDIWKERLIHIIKFVRDHLADKSQTQALEGTKICPIPRVILHHSAPIVTDTLSSSPYSVPGKSHEWDKCLVLTVILTHYCVCKEGEKDRKSWKSLHDVMRL